MCSCSKPADLTGRRRDTADGKRPDLGESGITYRLESNLSFEESLLIAESLSS